METIVCSCCGQELPVTEFYKQRERSGKIIYKHQCKACYKLLRSTDEKKQAHREAALRSYYKHRDEKDATKKRKARFAVKSEIRAKRMIRPSVCEKCGCEGRIEAHHHNGYEDEHVLDVVWLCRTCHEKEHHEC